MCLLSFSPARALAGNPANYEVVPLPQSIVMQKGEPFILEAGVEILATADLQQEAEFLKQYLKEVTWNDLPIVQKRTKKVRYIELAVSPNVKEAEGYLLTVSQKGVTILGGSAAGVFYGIQTLRKAVKEGPIMNPVIITDAPRFTWRGMHLDCSRHFFSVDFVKKFIDLLALHNMNRFHWHLTDDQGWRIEIKKWPKLISVGSKRSGTIIGTNSDIDDGIPYGGYYTQDEAREIVAYAAARHITVIPGIDMPGHMLAALASYTELGCTGGP
jgi:hexosaminidase